jgi:hypothetical protein
VIAQGGELISKFPQRVEEDKWRQIGLECLVDARQVEIARVESEDVLWRAKSGEERARPQVEPAGLA